MSAFIQDREWLDRQYNLRAAVPDRESFAAQWASLSEQARAGLQARLDLAYGDSPDERLDFFPASAAPAPILLFFHGGYWRANDKRDFSYPAPHFVSQGVAFASANYTLAPRASIAEMVEQARRAVLWVARNHADLGVDRSRIFVSGHSAGGHLTAMTVTTDWKKYGLDFDPVRGAISISGLYELEPLRHTFLNEVIRLDEEAAARNSPIAHIGSVDRSVWSSREFLFCVGGRETDEFRRQQDDFVTAWSGRSLRYSVVEEPDSHHYQAALKLGDPASRLFGAALRVIREAG